jgi:pimeloyl-ACP methyl ester carboxylesterase
MMRYLLAGMALMLAFSSIGAAQTCNGAVITAGNLDAYTAVGFVGFPTEGPTGTFTCATTVKVPYGQRFLNLRYQEQWRVAVPRFFTCNNGVGYCTNTLTLAVSGPGVSTDTVTLHADGFARPPSDGGPPWIFLGSDLVEYWARTVNRTIDVSAATRLGDATIQFQITDDIHGYTGSVGGNFTVGGLITILDPVPALQNGNQILTDVQTLATLGTPVQSIVADGAARVVLRLRATTPGQSITLNLLNDQGQVSQSPTADGTIASIGGAPGSGPVQLTSVNTKEGPMAFAVYQPPTDFSRNTNDDGAQNRSITLKAQLGTASPIIETVPLTILRPPVVLVHGLWGTSANWDTFTPFISDSRFSVTRAFYDYPISGVVSASSPGYSSDVLSKASSNALGFAFNAPIVLTEIQEAVVAFRQANNAAAAQVDVIAHSMGGTITRTLENLAAFTGPESFGVGNVHKLITIGTPHLGTPLSTQLIQVNNTCIRDLLADKKNVAFFTATVAGANVSGGAGDLQGDGSGGSMSGALNNLLNPNGHEVPTGLIVGTMATSNLSSLNCTLCGASYIRSTCSNNPLAISLTSTGWPTVFGGPSDGIVPRLSQLSFAGTGLEVAGVVHSSGLVGIFALSFTGPSELDPLSTVNTIQTSVIQLLNTPAGSSPFFKLP